MLLWLKRLHDHPTMSFAVAEYAKSGRDIVIGVDRRWVSGPDGAYVVDCDDGVKSIDLNEHAGIAFTGNSEVIAEVVVRLYADRELLTSPRRDILAVLEQRPHSLELDLLEVATTLDEIVPSVMAACDEGSAFSAILAGSTRREALMFWYAEETEWRCRPSRYEDYRRVRTLPSEAKTGSALQLSVDTILNGHGPSEDRIRRAMAFLEAHAASVGGGCLLRKLSGGFKRQ